MQMITLKALKSPIVNKHCLIQHLNSYSVTEHSLGNVPLRILQRTEIPTGSGIFNLLLNVIYRLHLSYCFK